MTYDENQTTDQGELRSRLLTHGRYVRPDGSFRPAQQVPIDMVTSSGTLAESLVEAAGSKEKPEKASRRTLFSAIIDATVQVERVTRQSVQTVKHTFEPPQISAMRSHRQKMYVRSFYAVGSLSFFAALILGFNALTHSGTKGPVTSVLGDRTISQNDATRNSEMPAENKPTAQDIATYLVAPQYPRYLRIPSIKVDTRIRRLGIDSKGRLATPNNINDAGWYDASVKPGEKEGASIIQGHVAGPTQHGVFWDLNKLNDGDRIEIEKGSGEIVAYKVTKVEKVPADQFSMNKYLATEVSGRHDLKLVTASGKYNIISGVYDTRVVVFAQRI
jgi:LPXTG-site transpeptidase (sortase) family protein